MSGDKNCRPKRQENGDWQQRPFYLKAGGHNADPGIFLDINNQCDELEVTATLRSARRTQTCDRQLQWSNDRNETQLLGGDDTAIEDFKQLSSFLGSTFTVDFSENYNHNSKRLNQQAGVLIFIVQK